jgi:hypothetical protein
MPSAWYQNIYVMEIRPCDFSSVADFGGINGWIEELILVKGRRVLEDGG